MGQDNIAQHRRYVAISYVFMFLALFTIVFALFAYLLARKVAIVDNAEVWIMGNRHDGRRCNFQCDRMVILAECMDQRSCQVF